MTARCDHGDDDSGRFCHGPLRDRSGVCHRPAGWGTPHPGIGRCKLHGGSTSSHVKAAAKQRARELVGRTLLGGPGVESVKDPVAFAQRLLGQLGHAVDTLEWLLGSVTDSDGNAVPLSDQQLATFGALRPVLSEARQLSEGLARLRLGERQVELDAERLQLVRVALGRAVAAAELGAGQRSTVFRVFAAEVRAGPGLLEIEDGD